MCLGPRVCVWLCGCVCLCRCSMCLHVQVCLFSARALADRDRKEERDGERGEERERRREECLASRQAGRRYDRVVAGSNPPCHNAFLKSISWIFYQITALMKVILPRMGQCLWVSVWV